MPFIAKTILLSVFAMNIFGFASAIHCTFTRPCGVSPFMRLLVISGLAAALGNSVCFVLISALSVTRGLFALVLLGVSHLLFRAARLATANRPLSLAFSPDMPTHLNRSGPYRFVRHPFYAAYTLTWLGATVATLHPVSFVALAYMVILYIAAALLEERKFLGSPFANAYREYRRTTGILVPRVFSLHNPKPYEH